MSANKLHSEQIEEQAVQTSEAAATPSPSASVEAEVETSVAAASNGSTAEKTTPEATPESTATFERTNESSPDFGGATSQQRAATPEDTAPFDALEATPEAAHEAAALPTQHHDALGNTAPSQLIEPFSPDDTAPFEPVELESQSSDDTAPFEPLESPYSEGAAPLESVQDASPSDTASFEPVESLSPEDTAPLDAQPATEADLGQPNSVQSSQDPNSDPEAFASTPSLPEEYDERAIVEAILAAEEEAAAQRLAAKRAAANAEDANTEEALLADALRAAEASTIEAQAAASKSIPEEDSEEDGTRARGDHDARNKHGKRNRRSAQNAPDARAMDPIEAAETAGGIVPTTRHMMPVAAPGRNQMPVDNRPGAETSSGTTCNLAWGARSDVGLVRAHNEDAFLAQAPLFVVCDGMGGHAAGEVASHIAVEAIAKRAPEHADEILLGAAVEAANEEVLEGALTGKGKPGMGCTASCVLIENNLMSIAHVGDSRVYLLHSGTLVRITHDHSYVEELVDAGEITADEARVHPSRSIITRALGSDPDMYADHFTLDVTSGDRIILCSDGLSSMVPDKEIEELAVSSVTPQAAADTLVSAALTAGGHDNVTVVVVDVVDDGLGELHRAQRRRYVLIWALIALAALVLAGGAIVAVVRNSWYVGNNDGTVAVYRGINDELFGVPLYEVAETSTVQVADLPVTLQRQLDEGIGVANMDEGCNTVENYRDQIDSAKTLAAETAGAAQSASGVGKQGSQGAAVESGDSTPPAAAQTGAQAADEASEAARQEAASGAVGQEGE